MAETIGELAVKWEAYVKGMEAGMPKLSEGSQEIASYQVLVAKRFIADLKALAAAAPAKWTCGNSDHACNLRGYCVNTNCSEFLGPPRGGSSSDLADSDSLNMPHKTVIVGMPTVQRLMARETVELPSFGVTLIPDDVLFNNRQEIMVLFGDDAQTGMRVFAAREKLGKGLGEHSQIVKPMDDESVRRASLDYQRVHSRLPEAVAGNASAPVGENEHATLQRIREWKAQGKMLTDAELLLLKLAGQPSGVGEPRVRCPECAVADQLQCVLDKGHEGDCMFAEWPYRAREVGEGLREAQLVDLRTLWMERAKRLRKDAAYIDCAVTLEACADELSSLFRLAAPAPKPAPPAERK